MKEPELDLARQLIDSLLGEWEPEALQSEYRQNLRQLLEAKLAGEEIAMPEPVADAPVIDLMDALKKASRPRRAARRTATSRPHARRPRRASAPRRSSPRHLGG